MITENQSLIVFNNRKKSLAFILYTICLISMSYWKGVWERILVNSGNFEDKYILTT